MAETDEDARASAAEGEAEIAERKLARGVAIGLPVATFVGFVAVSAVFGLAPGILVLVGGTLVGVISIFWASLRVLAGDAPLPPEVEALDAGAHAVDQLAVRKRMLLRALKDLDNEKALGKLEAEDHEALASTYRAELKDVLRRMDETLAPYRKNAEELAAKYLATRGIEKGELAGGEAKSEAKGQANEDDPPAPRAACKACGASNEPDARFCKACGKALTGEADAEEAEKDTKEPEDDA